VSHRGLIRIKQLVTISKLFIIICLGAHKDSRSRREASRRVESLICSIVLHLMPPPKHESDKWFRVSCNGRAEDFE
jgi:hypothetical protein